MPRMKDPLPRRNTYQPSHPSSKGYRPYLSGFDRPFRFLELPGESRRVIYRCLLMDPIDGIQPQYKGSRRVQNLHTGILRVSRQIYEEAWPALYQDNVYRYNIRADCEHLQRPLGIKMPDYAFSRIQKVEIGIHPVHCCLFIRDFLKIISYVQTLGAILKTFSLDLRLIGHAIREEQMDQIMEVGRSMVQRLASAICALAVQQSITVKASSAASRVVDWFEPLVSYITEEKKWKVTTDRKVYDLGEDDMDPAPFRHTWELCPMNIDTEADDGIGAGNVTQAGNAIQVGNAVQAGNAIQAGNMVQAGNATQAGNAVEAPRQRPWEL